MIYKNQTIGAIEGIEIIEFGSGTMSVTALSNKQAGYAGIGFKSKEFSPVGEDCEKTDGLTTDDVKPEIMMIFSTQESIDIIIQTLFKTKMELSKIQISKSNGSI